MKKVFTGMMVFAVWTLVFGSLAPNTNACGIENKGSAGDTGTDHGSEESVEE